VTTTPLDTFLEDKDPAWHALVRELDGLILAAAPALTARIAYKLLMYHLGTDKQRWVVAIDARPKAVVVRFLWGTLLDDPRGVLRGGTSTLMNVDLPAPDALDPAIITDLVTQAVTLYPAFATAR
jgi:hypothetical protein